MVPTTLQIPVSANADDFDTQLRQAVQGAMSDVLAEIRTAMTQANRILGQVNTSGMEQVGNSAQRASTQVSGITQAARTASNGLSRIDASALTQIVRGADGAADAMRQLDRFQLDALLASARRAGNTIGEAVPAGASHAERAIQSLNAADLDTLIRSTEEARRNLGRVTTEAETAADSVGDVGQEADKASDKGGKFGDMGSKLKEMGAKAAGAAAGLLAVGTAADAIWAAIEEMDLGSKMKAQLGLTADEAAAAGKVAADLFAGGFTADFAEANAAVTSVLGNFRDLNDVDLSKVTAAANDFAHTTDTDIGEASKTAGLLLKTGLAKDGVEAFDLLGKAAQNFGPQVAEELPGLVDAYAQAFGSIGASGEQAFGLFSKFADGGVEVMDHAGDAVKEFGVKITEFDDDSAQGFTDVGLNATEMFAIFQKGGPEAQAAFQDVIKRLQEMPDAGAQAQAAMELFGAPLGELGQDKIPKFIDALSTSNTSMEGFSGTVQRMGEDINSGPSFELQKLQNQIKQTLVDGLGEAIGYIQNTAIPAVKDFGNAFLDTDFATSIKDAFNVEGTGDLFESLISAVTTGAKKIPGIVVDFISEIPHVVKDFMRSIDWGDVGESLFNGLKDFLTSGGPLIVAAIAGLPLLIVGALIAAIVAAFVGIGQALLDAFNENVVPFLAGLAEDILNAIGDLAGAITGWFSEQWAAFTGTIGAVVDTTATFFTGLPGRIVGWIGDLGSALGGWFSQQWTNFTTGLGIIIDTASTFFSEIPGKVIGWAGDLAGQLGSWFSTQWSNFKAGLSAIVETISEPFSRVGEIITGAFDTVRSALSGISDFFGSVVEGIASVWNGLRNILAKPINFLIETVYNNGILKAWNAVAGFLPGISPASPLSGIPEAATGGPIFGPGSGTSDDVLMWGSNGEHMVTAMEVLKAGGHNVLYAIRDMIARGIPFTWDNGAIVPKLGRENLDHYGAAVSAKGFGNVDPQGLFNDLLPGYRTGGAIGKREDIEPWMLQLLKGHEFAEAQHGKPYQWAGPTGPGSSFDCSGFMGSIAAAIVGDDPWSRKFSTASFSGGGNSQSASGPYGFVGGTDAGFTIGVRNGGEGGGHTAGTLGGIYGIRPAVNVESGGQGVIYGGGPDPRSFPTQYHLGIGANGYFQPGGTSVGPSPEEQSSFLRDKVKDTFNVILDPIKGGIAGIIGSPPPAYLGIPPQFLDRGRDVVVDGAFNLIGGLGDALSAAWTKAKSVGSDVLSAVNPLNWFDSGGIANGVGFMAKNTISPERVLSPEQTRLFEALVAALQSISGSGGQAINTIFDSIGSAVSGVARDVIKAFVDDKPGEKRSDTIDSTFLTNTSKALTEQGQLLSDTQDLSMRTATNLEVARTAEFEKLRDQMTEIANRLTAGVLGPVVESAFDNALGVVQKGLVAGFEDVTDGTDRTTAAVNQNTATESQQSAAPAFGMPGSAFDAASVISNAIVGVANTASSSIMAVGQDIAKAALAQTPSKVSQSSGVLGKDVSGGFLVDMLVRLTGVEIQIRDTLTASAEDAKKFRGDAFKGFDETGALLSDTASLIERSETSQETAISEMNRINQALIKALLKYLMLAVVIPVLTAILGAMITVATTAIGAAIGSVIPVIGTAIGAAVGALVGVGLTALAAGFIATAATGVGAAIDAFDEGGIANGIGVMPKRTIQPERVLSPRQTQDFGRLVDAMERNSNRTTIHAPFNVAGDRRGGETVRNHLLQLMNS